MRHCCGVGVMITRSRTGRYHLHLRCGDNRSAAASASDVDLSVVARITVARPVTRRYEVVQTVAVTACTAGTLCVSDCGRLVQPVPPTNFCPHSDQHR